MDDDTKIIAYVNGGDAIDSHPDMNFVDYLHEFEGCTWDDFHKLYYPSDVRHIMEKYQWKRTGLPFFARDYYKMEV